VVGCVNMPCHTATLIFKLVSITYYTPRYVWDLNNLSSTILIMLFYIQECSFRRFGHFGVRRPSLSCHVRLFEWGNPLRHVDFAFSDVLGWGNSPHHITFVFFDVLGWENSGFPNSTCCVHHFQHLEYFFFFL